jgi:hypothetical protein
VLAVEHGERKRWSERARPPEESGGNDGNHFRVRKKNEGARTRLENKLEEGEAVFYSQAAMALSKEERRGRV